MANYQEARVELTNTKLSKSKSAAKYKIGTTIRLNQKNLLSEHEELPHELFLTTRETAKIRNALANNTSADIELSKIQICDKFNQVDLVVPFFQLEIAYLDQ